jgi:hypothetical protein
MNCLYLNFILASVFCTRLSPLEMLMYVLQLSSQITNYYPVMIPSHAYVYTRQYFVLTPVAKNPMLLKGVSKSGIL